MLRVPHVGFFQSTFVTTRYLESQTVFVFVGPPAVYYADATSLGKNLANVTRI